MPFQGTEVFPDVPDDVVMMAATHDGSRYNFPRG